jgi:hypothetical protein
MVFQPGIHVGTVTVVPVEDRPRHLTRDGQRHAAVALAGGGGLELGHPLFQVGTAIATKVGCLG